MNKTLIANIDNRDIYLVNDDKLSFYINMPSNVSTCSIMINLLDNSNGINISINNVDSISREINKIYGGFHFNDIVIITPVLDSNLSEQIKLNNDEKIFVYTDRIISYLINSTYGLLTEEGINVNKVIKLNNVLSYKVFNEWFIKKYEGRVELFNNKISFDAYDNKNQEEVGNVGNKSLADEVLDNTGAFAPVGEDDTLYEKGGRELGFVSYVLLGVLVAVISLVLLYMLL